MRKRSWENLSMHLKRGLENNMNSQKEVRIKGFPVSEGIAIGIPLFWVLEEESIPAVPITLGEVDDEINRYRNALSSSREDLHRLKKDLVQEGSEEAVTILDSHIQMLEDPLITTNMEEKIRQMMQNTESVFHSVMTDYENRFTRTTESIFQQRMADVVDLAKRVLSHLSPYSPKRFSFADVPPNSIIFAKELLPSFTATAHVSRVSAFVTQVGGGNSHAALIARAKGIPYVASVNLQEVQSMDINCVIVDGKSGEVILNPSPETLEEYKHKKTDLKTSVQTWQKAPQYASETIDGCQIRVLANIGHSSDLDNLEELGAEGVGLFRTEYLFFQNRTLFSSQDEQYRAYAALIEKVGNRPLVIRVFDFGGDKDPDFLEQTEKEPNPVLGCRGIRFLLRHREIFRTQLKAILRAATQGNVRILLPLISDLNELTEARRLIEEVRGELKLKGYRVSDDIPVGCMIEVPSAVLICDALAKHCDFLSIGTNDLIQYTLGIDRSNPGMNDFCYPAHPSVIRMIKMVITEAKRHRKSVAICGEIASNPIFIPLLLGLGVAELSCSPRYIPLVKRAIRQTRLLDAFELAQHVLTLNSSLDISQVLLEAYNKTDLAKEG